MPITQLVKHNIYPFELRPSTHQPSGTVNRSCGEPIVLVKPQKQKSDYHISSSGTL